MRKVELRMNEQEKYDVIKELVDHNRTKNRTAKKLKCFKPKTECLVIKAYNGDLIVSIDERVFELRELARNKSFSECFKEVDNTTKSKAHVPDMQHPWKVAEFKKQQRRTRLQNLYA